VPLQHEQLYIGSFLSIPLQPDKLLLHLNYSMITDNKIKFYLDTFKTLRFEDLVQLLQMAKEKTLQPGEAYIKQGTLHRKLCYITKGLVRIYTFRKNGEEATLQLYWEDQFFASRHSVLLNQPCPFIFEAVEQTELLEVDFNDMQALLDANIQYAPSRNFFLTEMLSQALDRVESFILLSPEERYGKLVAEKPDIVNRVPNKFIATMLGITPVSLSRIRKRMASKH
jgi:CRP-like cAMP-binding protein